MIQIKILVFRRSRKIVGEGFMVLEYRDGRFGGDEIQKGQV